MPRGLDHGGRYRGVRRLFAGLAMLALAADLGAASIRPARADPYLFSDFALSPIRPGGLYFGAGVVEGLYSLPTVASTRLVDTQVGFSRHGYRPTPMFTAPGWTVGYLFREGSYPASLGRNLRIDFAGSYWSSGSGETATTDIIPNSTYTHTSLSGIVIKNSTTPSGRLRTTVETEHSRLDVALRLASDRRRRLLRGRVSTSIGLFGGFGRDEFFMHTVEVAPSLRNASKFTERIESGRIGLDGALSWTRRLSETWELNLSGRAGVYYLWAKLEGTDCGNLVPGSNNCSYGGPAFTALGEGYRSGLASTGDDTVGFLTTATVSLTWRLGIATARIGTFFTFESAVAGAQNPYAPVGAPQGAFVGAARLKFKPAWSTGGFLTIKIPLYAAN